MSQPSPHPQPWNRRPRPKAWLQRNLQVFISSLGRLWSHPAGSFMTIMVIGIALALPLSFYLLVNNVQALTGQWNSAASLSLYLKTETPDSTVEQLKTRLRQQGMQHIRHIAPEQALREFQAASGFSEALDLLDNNPLPHTLIFSPPADQQSPAAMRQLLEEYQALPEVEVARADLQWLQRLQAITRLVGRAVLALSVLLALAVVLIIGNTIRLELQGRRHEIEVIKLVGGTNRFIRRPFLYEGLWYGLLGGITGCLLVWAALLLLSGPVGELRILYDSRFTLQPLDALTILHVLAGSALLGILGAGLAVSRHLNEIEPS